MSVHAIENAAPGLWTLAWRRLRADRLAMAALAVVGAWLVLIALSALGLVAADWEEEVGAHYAPPSFVGAPAARTESAGATQAARDNPFDPLAADIAALRSQLPGGGAAPERRATLPFGADKWGHDVLKKTVKGAETSIVVGLVAALVAVGIGTLFGALSGYWGGVVDDAFTWLYNVFTAIPSILMILTVAAVLQHKGVTTVVLILGLTGWTGPYRLIRAEYMKHKAREYVLAAQAIGASHWRRMFAHIFPNASHVALVQVSILVVGFIKAEVILSFLGFGVPVGVVSWGSMLNEAQNELLLGKWWQLAAAASAMAILVTAFSLFADALRDALDPKVK
ncbi:peptide/nickel transport system permease protein [Pseudoduganella flava]|uniref:ABC transporter permease subunit n=1 Tax=Pseudoduganella flava TaxID=871742 RepID=A0A562Q5X6_9BURK|nr:ABC transporter permease [Pseudoduganella flava]QGZ41475.1 ABC transporter permease subunit [Pseudoduganella flava]TWI51436.1 peptide/nickel transport system permease protein [Pseudoduganella flava]